MGEQASLADMIKAMTESVPNNMRAGNVRKRKKPPPPIAHYSDVREAHRRVLLALTDTPQPTNAFARENYYILRVNVACGVVATDFSTRDDRKGRSYWSRGPNWQAWKDSLPLTQGAIGG